MKCPSIADGIHSYAGIDREPPRRRTLIENLPLTSASMCGVSSGCEPKSLVVAGDALAIALTCWCVTCAREGSTLGGGWTTDRYDAHKGKTPPIFTRLEGLTCALCLVGLRDLVPRSSVLARRR